MNSTTAPTNHGRLRCAAQALVIALAVWWVYAPALHGDWLWDDNTEITANPELRDPRGWWHAWTAPAGPDYFPLKTDVQWLQWRMWGDASTLGYHATNLALHFLSALLVWRLLRRLGLHFGWLGGLLFAVHPVAVESVAWIAELKNVLSLPLVLFSFDAWLDFDESRSPRAFARAWLCFLAALLCKTSVVMLPTVLLLFGWWRRGRIGFTDFRRTAPFFLAALGFGLVTVFFQEHRAIAGWALPESNLIARILGSGRALAFYLEKCLWPSALSPIYPAWLESSARALGVLAWLAMLGLAGAGVRWRATWGRHAMLGLGFFALNLLPVLGFIPMSFQHVGPVADHFAYIALIGVAGLLVWATEMIVAQGFFLWAIPIAVVGGLALVGRNHAGVFSGPETLWRSTLARNPDAALAHNNLGVLRLKQERWTEAAAQLEAAVRLAPRDALARTNLGTAFAHLGQLDAALAQQREAVQLDPASATAHFNLANTLALAGQPVAAIPHYRTALAATPDVIDVQFNFANALTRAGQFREAISEYRRVLRTQPTFFDAELNLGNALAASGAMSEATEHFARAVRLAPDSAEAHYCLADALVELDHAAEAIAHYETALRLKPNDAGIRARLEALRARR